MSVPDVELPTRKRRRSRTKLDDESDHTNSKVLKTGEHPRDSTTTVKPDHLELTSNADQNQLHTEFESSPIVSTRPVPQNPTEQKDRPPTTPLISKPRSESRQLLTNITSRAPSFDGSSLNSQQVPTRSGPRYEIPTAVPPLYRERSRILESDNGGVSSNNATPSKPPQPISSISTTALLPAAPEDTFLIPTLKPMALQRARTILVSLSLFSSWDCLCFIEHGVP